MANSWFNSDQVPTFKFEKKGPCRLWNFFIFGVSTLAVYNIVLTLKLTYSNECIKNAIVVEQNREPEVRSSQICQPELQKNAEHLFQNLDVRLGRWDSRRLYKLFDNVAVGDRFLDVSDRYVTCLATQSSLEKLESLIEVASQWTGPISVAAFAAGDEEFSSLLLYIAYLRQCFPNIRDRVTFHLAFPENHQPSKTNWDVNKDISHDCETPEKTLQALLKPVTGKKWRTQLPYPQNHLRNLARKNCQSKYVFLTDVDIIPCNGLADSLDLFMRGSNCQGLCAFVIPTYELDTRVQFPSNKSELVRLANKGLTQPFHHKVFIYNQYATNFSRWQSSVQDDSEVHISHPVTNFEFLYEPFYVATDTVPPHDERFVGYGYTRNTQVYEMFVAGYEFQVLSPIFTCHWGLQVRRSRPSWRERQNSQNRKQFDIFKHEVFAKYKRDPLNVVNPKKRDK